MIIDIILPFLPKHLGWHCRKPTGIQKAGTSDSVLWTNQLNRGSYHRKLPNEMFTVDLLISRALFSSMCISYTRDLKNYVNVMIKNAEFCYSALIPCSYGFFWVVNLPIFQVFGILIVFKIIFQYCFLYVLLNHNLTAR